MEILKPGRPPGWELPKLTSYFEHLWANTVATFAKKLESHRVCRIDELMCEVATDWKATSPTVESIVPLMMFFRAHAAFRGAAALGMGGSTVEGMAVLRLSLEFAGYAALVGQVPLLAMVWFDRDVDVEKQKAVRKAFTHSAVEAAIAKYDSDLASIYDKLYDRLIQFGAHPNEKSITGNLKLDIQKAQTLLNQVYLQDDNIQIDHWIMTANQVGLCVLKVFEYVHAARFVELKIGERIDALAQGM
jgi:hypothetical protein